jgi:hypothetical protein
MNSDNLNSSIDYWVSSVNNLDIVQAKDYSQYNGGEYSDMNLDEYSFGQYQTRFNGMIDDAANKTNLNGSDAHNLIVSAMEPLSRYDNYSGTKNEVSNEMQNLISNNISVFMENDKFDNDSFNNDAKILLDALPPFVRDIATESIVAANDGMSADDNMGFGATFKPSDHIEPEAAAEEMNTFTPSKEYEQERGEFSPSEYLPRVGRPAPSKEEDDSLSM